MTLVGEKPGGSQPERRLHGRHCEVPMMLPHKLIPEPQRVTVRIDRPEVRSEALGVPARPPSQESEIARTPGRMAAILGWLYSRPR